MANTLFYIFYGLAIFLAACTFFVGFLYTGFIIFKFLGLEKAITLFFSFLIISVSIFYILDTIFKVAPLNFVATNIFAFLSFGVMFFSISLFIFRVGFISLSKTSFKFLKEKVRDFLIFLNKFHIYFGWIVLATATAHGIYFLALFSSTPKIISGVMAWFVLVVLVGLGLWIDMSKKKGKYRKNNKYIHITLACLFVILVIVHILVPYY